MEINKYFIFFVFSFLLISCYQQERNCTDYKTGKFEFQQEINGKVETSVFERSETLQIETFRGKTDTSTVRWVNDCEFILQKLHPKNRAEKKAVQMKILTTNQNGYTFEYSFVGETSKQKGTVTQIN